MIGILLSPEGARELANAVHLYRNHTKRAGLVPHPEVLALGTLATQRVKERQGATDLDRRQQVRQRQSMPAALLTSNQAAARLGCSVRTLQRRVSAGDIAVVRDGGLRRFRLSDLTAYIDSHTRK